MIEDLIRTGLTTDSDPAAPPGLGPLVRSRSQRRRRTQFALASVAAGGLAVGATTVGVTALGRDDNPRPAVLAALPSASASGQPSSCAAGPFSLTLNGQSVLASAGFEEVTGRSLTRRGGAAGQSASDQRWTLHTGSDNAVSVALSDGPGGPTQLRLVQLTLTTDPSSGEVLGLADPTQGQADATHSSAEAGVNLRLNAGEQAPAGDYGLDVMVSLLDCPTGAVHVVQPVTITS